MRRKTRSAPFCAVPHWGLAALVVVACLPLLVGQGCPAPAADGGTDPVTGPVGPQGPAGEPGPQGPAGADGQLRIYGDGSAGDLIVAASSDLNTLIPSHNFQFANVTVNSGVTLTVASGTVIRCSGTFTNNGTIQVSFGEVSGGNGGSPGAGVAHSSAGNSVSSTIEAFQLNGSAGGVGLTLGEAAVFLEVTPNAGGAGGGRFEGYLNVGGSGGGQLVVLAQGAIVNSATGTIRADGQSTAMIGSAGGAGGIVILASPASVTHAGVISARGGKGANAGANTGGGGGGGGGIVHLISPTIPAAGGTVDVSGGGGGSGGPGVAGTRFGGAGGGGCGGSGGEGGAVANAPLNTLLAGSPAKAGYSLQTLADPTALFW